MAVKSGRAQHVLGWTLRAPNFGMVLFQCPRHEDEKHQQDPQGDRLLFKLAHGRLPLQTMLHNRLAPYFPSQQMVYGRFQRIAVALPPMD